MAGNVSAAAGMTGERTGRFHIPSLDGLRAVSIAIVFVSHAGLEAIPGGFGVTVFFFLSGYLITTLLRREFAITGTVHLPSFYWRRAWRIFPPMYVALAFGVVVSLSGLTLGTPSVAAVAAQALHLSNYASLTELTNGIPLGTHVFWSLAVEEHFYLLFPVCALFLMRRYSPSIQAAVLYGVCAVTLAWRMVLVGLLDASVERTFFSTDTRIDAILFGCALALHRNPMLDDRPKRSDRTVYGTVACAVVIILISMVIRGDFYRETLRYSIQSLALTPIFVAAITRPDLGPFRLLNHRWVEFVGVLSYSLYLVHLVVILAIRAQRPTVSTPVMIVVAGAISLAIAYGFHVFIEQPAAKARKRHAVVH